MDIIMPTKSYHPSGVLKKKLDIHIVANFACCRARDFSSDTASVDNLPGRKVRCRSVFHDAVRLSRECRLREAAASGKRATRRRCRTCEVTVLRIYLIDQVLDEIPWNTSRANISLYLVSRDTWALFESGVSKVDREGRICQTFLQRTRCPKPLNRS